MDIDAELWARLAPLLPRERGNTSVAAIDVIRAVLHVQDSGCSWRQLPAAFGNWHTVYTRARRWTRSGVLAPVIDAIRQAQQGDAALPGAELLQRGPAAVPKAQLKAVADELRPLIFSLAMHLKNERRRLPVSQDEVAILMGVQSHPAGHARAMAQVLELSAASMGVRVRRLAAEGWLKPAGRSSADRRNMRLVITESGAALLDRVRAGRTDQLLKQFGQLDPASLAAVEAALLPLRHIAQGLRLALPPGAGQVRPQRGVRRAPPAA